jgi:class 3 adenylate cyclase
MLTLRAMGPDGSTQAAPVTRGFLFADLRGYTAFTEAHGDKQARDLLDAYRRVVRDVVGQFGGAEIKTEGDSFYVVFPSATAAVKCGIALVDAAAKASHDRPDLPIHVGVGIHAGETAESDEGYVGSAVNVAARLGAAANAGEVLVSETVRGLTRTGGEVRYVSIGNRRFKGISEPIAVFAAVDAGGDSIGRGRRSRLAVGWRGAAIAAVLVATLVIVFALVGPGLTGLLSAANESPSPTARLSPASSSEATGTVPASSGAPVSRTPTALPDVRIGEAPAGSYQARRFYLKPEFELPEGWTVGTCQPGNPPDCSLLPNNGYDPGLIQLKLVGHPESQLVLYHPTVYFNDPCALELSPTASPPEPFLAWLRKQPALEVGTAIARDFDHVHTTYMDVSVGDEGTCSTTTPLGVALRGYMFGGGTYYTLDSGDVIRLYALNSPSEVFAFVTAPSQEEFDLLLPKAEEVLNSLEFPNP